MKNLGNISFVRSHKYFPSFSHDCSDKIFWGSTVTFLNMQLAFYMGFRHVYLIGMDFNYNIPEYAKGMNILSKDQDMVECY